MAITQRIDDAATKAACDTWCQYDAMIQRAHHVEDHDADPQPWNTRSGRSQQPASPDFCSSFSSQAQ